MWHPSLRHCFSETAKARKAVNTLSTHSTYCPCKNQSMLTVEGPSSKVTRNSSHFKRFMTGESVTLLFRLRNLLLMLTWKPVPCLLHLPRVRSLQTLGLLTLPIVPRPQLKSCFEGLPDCPSLRRDLFKRFDQILFNTYVDYEHCCWTFLISDMSY